MRTQALLAITLTLFLESCVPLAETRVCSGPIAPGESGLLVTQDPRIGGLFIEDLSGRLQDRTVTGLGISRSPMLRFPYLHNRQVSWEKRANGFETITMLLLPPGRYRIVGFQTVQITEGALYSWGAPGGPVVRNLQAGEDLPELTFEVTGGKVVTLGHLSLAEDGESVQLDTSSRARAGIRHFLDVELDLSLMPEEDRTLLETWRTRLRSTGHG